MNLTFSKPTSTTTDQRLLFDRYRDLGYDGLQLKGGQYAAYLDRPDAFRSEWSADPAAVSSLITMNPLDPAGTDQLRAIARFAAATGSERIVFCHSVPRDGLADADIAEIARAVSRLGVDVADLGVRLSLHHHHNQPVMHRHDFDVFFDAVDAAAPGSVALTVDTAHLAKSGVTDIPGLIRDLAAVIDNIHLKDFRDGEFRLLGEGDLDFVGIFAALDDIGFEGTLCVDEESRAGLLEGMEVSRRYLASAYLTT